MNHREPTRRIPPGRPATEAAAMAAQALATIAACGGCIAFVDAMALPQWATTAATMLLGGAAGLHLVVLGLIEGPRRMEHARRWRDDPDYRKLWGQGL